MNVKLIVLNNPYSKRFEKTYGNNKSTKRILAQRTKKVINLRNEIN